MTDKIPIPSSIADVTPELCRRVFVEVLGGLIYHEKGELKGSRFVFCLGDVWSTMDHYFNPFENIFDTKLLDKWVVENEREMELWFNGEIYHCKIFRKTLYERELICHCGDKTEEMARACAIIDAYNKLKGEK